MKIKFSQTALTVLAKRYQQRDAEGNTIETPEEMLRRVANFIGQEKEERDNFFHLMANQFFLPNSPTLMNAGLELGQLSACFVVPVEDNIESIFDAVKSAAIICKSGGGVGYSFSKLRPENDPVASTAGVASGPISFMEVFDTATEVIKQGGRRRGANMGVLHVSHPDIEKFITYKTDEGRLNNFNVSVALTDEFMKAVEDDSSFTLRNPRSGEIVSNISARELFNRIAESAWASAEPGVMFIDAINRDNPTPHLGDIESTNPCGEQPLLPFESCNLGSINLSEFVTHNGKVDIDGLKEVVKCAVRFLDNVIDQNKYPLPEIREATLRTRKIGLGVMGFADMLIKMGIPYASKKAENLAETVMEIIQEAAKTESNQLASERGTYPACHRDRTYRNATVTTIAPTGTISILAGCSSGIEPLFSLAFRRTILGGETFVEFHPMVRSVIKPKLSDYKWKKFEVDLSMEGYLTDELVEKYELQEIAPLLQVANQIPWKWHLRIQAAFQKFTDNAVSKTINLDESASVKDVANIYREAWKLGLKGVTVYRDKCRKEQVISSGHKTNGKEPRERPDTTFGRTECTQTGCGKLYVTLNQDSIGLCEVFAQMGKQGGCENAQIESIGRLISLALRGGIKTDAIVKQLYGIRCPNPCWRKGKQIFSCADAIAKVLAEHGNVDIAVSYKPVSCPDCGAPMEHKEGCETCPSCGFSKCK